MGYNETWRESTHEILDELEDLKYLESWLMREHKEIYNKWCEIKENLNEIEEEYKTRIDKSKIK